MKGQITSFLPITSLCATVVFRWPKANGVSSGSLPSKARSVILRYFGDHCRISQRSIRFKIMAFATKGSNRKQNDRIGFKAMHRHKFT